MKRNINKFICLVIVPLMALCGCDTQPDLYTHSIPFNSTISLYIYEENEEEEIYKLNTYGDYIVTLETNKTYVALIYNYPTHGVLFIDDVISFEYDEEYIDIEDYNLEVDDNKFSFVGLKETEETTVIIHNDLVVESKTMKITLVAPDIDSD